jgi:Cu/Ag efflux pump CusA
MNRELNKIPGAVWGFSQPIEDNMEEAVSGVKGELATKIYGDDLKVLEDKADQILSIIRGVQGIEDLGVLRVLGQPNLNLTVDRAAAARYQINVSDVQDAIQTAVGGSALTQVLKGGSCRPPGSGYRLYSSARSALPTAALKFIAKAIGAMWPSSTAFVGVTSAAP